MEHLDNGVVLPAEQDMQHGKPQPSIACDPGEVQTLFQVKPPG